MAFMLHQISPSLFVDNSAYCRLRKAIVFGDVILRFSLFIAAAYLTNIVVFNSSGVMPFPECRPSFFGHVFHVVELSSNKKMHRIDARGIVAAMADAHAGRYFANAKLVCNPMRLGVFAEYSSPAIAVGSFPDDAPIVILYADPGKELVGQSLSVPRVGTLSRAERAEWLRYKFDRANRAYDFGIGRTIRHAEPSFQGLVWMGCRGANAALHHHKSEGMQCQCF